RQERPARLRVGREEAVAVGDDLAPRDAEDILEARDPVGCAEETKEVAEVGGVDLLRRARRPAGQEARARVLEIGARGEGDVLERSEKTHRVRLAESGVLRSILEGERAREELDVGKTSSPTLEIIVARGLDLLLAHLANRSPQPRVRPRVKLVREDARRVLG